MTKSERREVIIDRRSRNESYASIARDLLGDPGKKSTINRWARRHIPESLLNAAGKQGTGYSGKIHEQLVEIKERGKQQDKKLTKVGGLLGCCTG